MDKSIMFAAAVAALSREDCAQPDAGLALGVVLHGTSTLGSDFAALCGVSKQAVSAWCKGRNPIPQRAISIALDLAAGSRRPTSPASAGPTLGALSIDALSCTADVARRTAPGEVLRGIGATVRPNVRRVGARPPLYRSRAMIGRVRVDFDPHDVRGYRRDVRIDVNPARMAMEEWSAACEIVAALGVDEEANVTRVDVAVDYVGVSVDDVWLRIPRRRHMTVENGQRIGSTRSEVYLRSYDRAREGSASRTTLRIEAQVRPRRLSVQSLTRVRDPFTLLRVAVGRAAQHVRGDACIDALADRIRADSIAAVVPGVRFDSVRLDLLEQLAHASERFIEHPSTTFERAFAGVSASVRDALFAGVLPPWASTGMSGDERK